jgi:hypothetical protein
VAALEAAGVEFIEQNVGGRAASEVMSKRERFQVRRDGL